jgi:hypothetical protein
VLAAALCWSIAEMLLEEMLTTSSHGHAKGHHPASLLLLDANCELSRIKMTQIDGPELKSLVFCVQLAFC